VEPHAADEPMDVSDFSRGTTSKQHGPMHVKLIAH
jgi:hypothetical protein